MSKKEENREFSSNFYSFENQNILKKLAKIDKLIKETESITGKDFKSSKIIFLSQKSLLSS